MSRRPTPIGIKVLQGTLRKDDLTKEQDAPTYKVLEQAPDIPPTLNGDGATIWLDLCRKLIPLRVLQDVDLYVLEQLCYTWQRFRAAARAGDDISAADNANLRTLFAEFGMTPASRRKVAVPTDKPTGNKFANNGKPRA